jgi:hypothetical protein
MMGLGGEPSDDLAGNRGLWPVGFKEKIKDKKIGKSQKIRGLARVCRPKKKWIWVTGRLRAAGVAAGQC